MSTPGVIGFIENNIFYAVRFNFDAHPSIVLPQLGEHIITDLKDFIKKALSYSNNWDTLKDIIENNVSEAYPSFSISDNYFNSDLDSFRCAYDACYIYLIDNNDNTVVVEGFDVDFSTLPFEQVRNSKSWKIITILVSDDDNI